MTQADQPPIAQASAELAALGHLEQIAAREPVVRAFAQFDADRALDAARAADRAAAAGGARGPLFGVAVGVKDVIDTHDWPTGYGSPIYEGHQPAADAPVVTMTRALGGLVFGKTVTTEFATFPPGPTTNPHNPAHTPGGSSSGSAAAVAAGFVRVAFGTQTTGSVVRPAAFCGVAGFKPSFGTLPRVGVKAISDQLDTVGVLAPCVADVAAFMAALTRRPELARRDGREPKLAFCRTPQWDSALPETQQLFERVASALEDEAELPPPFAGLAEAQGIIWDYEMARCLADEHRRFPERIRERLRTQLDAGWEIPHDTYERMSALARRCRRLLTDALGDYDALVVPAATGEAPLGLEATGDPVFNRIWSLLHGPAVSVPCGKGPRGLPLALQVVGRIGDDAKTLACAEWVERRLVPKVAQGA